MKEYEAKTTAWLVRDKVGKMRRSVWFNREHATMHQLDYQEVKRIEITIVLAKNKYMKTMKEQEMKKLLEPWEKEANKVLEEKTWEIEFDEARVKQWTGNPYFPDWEGVKSFIKERFIEKSRVEEVKHALQDYLMAGHKNARRLASIKAQIALANLRK